MSGPVQRWPCSAATRHRATIAGDAVLGGAEDGRRLLGGEFLDEAELVAERVLEDGATDREQPGYVIVASLGTIGLLFLTAFFTVPSFCGCDPAYEIGAILLVMIAATGVRHASSILDVVPGWLVRSAAFAGYGSLALLLALGIGRTVDQLQRIL